MATISITNDFNGIVNVVTDSELSKGDSVVFESSNGIFLGRINSISSKKADDECSFIRIASKKDLSDYEANKKECNSVLTEVRKIAIKLELDMVFVEAIYTLDKKRLYVSFVSDNRVDFRELAKRLAQKYHSRIEFRQIGVRDKSKKIGGIGPCGLMLCCNTFLSDFESVSINMAKNQMLALNPNKINGVCGRLKCCLKYENEIYKEKRKNMPKISELIETNDGMGKVIDINILQRTAKVELQNKTVISMDFGE